MGNQNYHALHLVDAMQIIAKCDNYMIGLTNPEDYCIDEFNEARQILINRQNLTKNNSKSYKRLELSLDLLEQYLSTSQIVY